MADEEQAIASGAPETASPGVQQQAEEPVNLNAPAEAPDEGAAEAEEFEEFEWNGKPIRGPKGLKDGVLMHGDYTRKTQEVAATKKELEQRAQQIAQQAKLAEDDIRDRGMLHLVDQRISEYEALSAQDWAHHRAQDPIGTENAWTEYQLLRQQREGLSKTLGERAAQRNQESQQSFAKRLEETRAYAQKNIPGWSTDLSNKVLECAATDLGMTREFVTDNMSPSFLTLLHRAYVGVQALKKPANLTALPSNVQPLVTVGAKSNPAAGKSLADMSMEEYVAARRKGVGGKALA